MKRALQGILIAGEDAKERVLSGLKRITIREGHRDYTPGPVLIGCHHLNWVVMKEIVEVYHTTLDGVSIVDAHADGFMSLDEALWGLRKFYPHMTMESPVTVIKWKDVT